MPTDEEIGKVVYAYVESLALQLEHSEAERHRLIADLRAVRAELERRDAEVWKGAADAD